MGLDWWVNNIETSVTLILCQKLGRHWLAAEANAWFIIIELGSNRIFSWL